MAKHFETVVLLTLLAFASVASHAEAATVAVETFDPPGTPIGPSAFALASPSPQTIVTPGVATFTGGVVLGNASIFPAISVATQPNVYATANFGSGLSNLLNIAINPAFSASEVSFALFNGEGTAASYEAQAFNGATLVDGQTFANVAPNLNSGNVLVDLVASNITNVKVFAEGTPTNFDFEIDTVAFNESAEQAVSQVPLPGGIGLFGAALFAVAGFGIRSRRNQIKADI